MKPEWILKRNPDRHPVRYLAGIWQRHTGKQMTPREYGQLRDFRGDLGGFAEHVIEWILDPVNWWRFSQQVRMEGKLHRVPDKPEIGFLHKHRMRALNFVRRGLEHSSSAADIKFVQELDEMRRKEMKTFLLIYTKGKSEWIERIEKADSLIAMQQIFIEAMNEEPTLKATISSPPEHCN